MPDTATAPMIPSRRPPPIKSSSVFGWIHANLFSSVFNTVMTLLAIWAIFVTIPGFIQWAFLNSVWYTDDPNACRDATGACWAVVAEKHRVMLFGTFPYDEHWRGVLSIAIITSVYRSVGLIGRSSFHGKGSSLYIEEVDAWMIFTSCFLAYSRISMNSPIVFPVRCLFSLYIVVEEGIPKWNMPSQ